MTTGSLAATEAERRFLCKQTRWWNSTGGGSHGKLAAGVNPTTKGIGAVKSGDGGLKFKTEWHDLDQENWNYIKENKIDPVTGRPPPPICSPETVALLGRSVGSGALGEVQAARNAGQGWLWRNKLMIAGGVCFVYVVLARLLQDTENL